MTLIERLRARINATPWKPGDYPTLDDELLAYLLRVQGIETELNKVKTELSWATNTTHWGI